MMSNVVDDVGCNHYGWDNAVDVGPGAVDYCCNLAMHGSAMFFVSEVVRSLLPCFSMRTQSG